MGWVCLGNNRKTLDWCPGSAQPHLRPVCLPLRCLRLEVMPLGTHAQAASSDKGSMHLRIQSWQDGRMCS